AAGRRGRARARRRAVARHRERRDGDRLPQRHVPPAARADREGSPQRRRAHRARARGRPARHGGGEGVVEPWWISLIKAAIIVNLVMVTFAYLTWLERKGLGRLQNRYG